MNPKSDTPLVIDEGMRVTARLALIITASVFLIAVGAGYATLQYGQLHSKERIDAQEAQTTKLMASITDQSIQIAALRTDVAVVKSILERQERFQTSTTTVTRLP